MFVFLKKEKAVRTQRKDESDSEIVSFCSRLRWIFFFSFCRRVFTRGKSRAVIQFFFERAQTCVPDKLDLSLCTVGTSSAFLQTADNICLLTCTVTCRTLLTRTRSAPHPTSSLNLWSTNPVGPFTSGCQ